MAIPTPRSDFPADWRLSLQISNLVGRAATLTRDLAELTDRLSPLDELSGHDVALSDEQMEAGGFDLRRDAVKTSVGLALVDLQHSVRHAQAAYDHVRGLLRGSAKHDFEELLARGVRSNQDRLDRMQRFYDGYIPPRTPFGIRRVQLSSLTEHCWDVAERTKAFRCEQDGISADFLQSIRNAETQLFALKGVIAKLRDNPSQKMAQPLRDCTAQAQAVFATLSSVMESAKIRSGRPY